MPRISLWKNAKTQDYHYQDRLIREAVDAGGTTMLVHKYLGPATTDADDPTQPKVESQIDISELDIQDVLFMENRDRIYDTTIYELRGTYNVGDQDFDLSQFGLFLSADTVFITFHINDMVERLGRKLMSGDVIELPHLKDDLLLDATAKSINKFYVVQDASRAAEGFGPTWWPHLWRVKCTPMNDAQEYRDILGDPQDEDSLKNAISTYSKDIEISTAIVEAAKEVLPEVGWNKEEIIAGSPDMGNMLVGNADAMEVKTTPDKTSVPSGLTFPDNPLQGEFFVRTDFVPNRLFVYRGTRWNRVYDSVEQMGWTEKTVNAGPFINNETQTTSSTAEEGTVPERQALSRVFRRPRTDE